MLSKEQNRKYALERQAVASARTPAEQLERLDLKFGVGLGAKKERAKLAKRMLAPQVKVVEVVEEEKREEG